ncbi:MAG: TAT-variant-translocated molybdopterin oxidoreductase [Acidobacteria bacterium]|nr:TAT-variant-translocated molybdopterin oxidoreductase [Acidobacteriota bacterium]
MAGSHSNRYWKSMEERIASAESRAGAGHEFPESLELAAGPIPRRDFLKAAGFTFLGAALTGCQRAPVEKAIPYLVKPEEIIPGRAYFYASTCGGCSAGCGLLVKNRDGRPIKLEGNPEHPLSKGGLCAVGQASVLGLYDSRRILLPLRDGKEAAWEEVDREITAKLNEIRREGGAVRFLSDSISSPTTLATLAAFLGRFPNARHVVYDPLSCSAIPASYEQTHGVGLLPRLRFENADVVVSFDADFLATWISPVEYTAGYQAARSLEAEPPRFSYHAQFESRMSLTGSKADQRIRVAPQELGLVVTHLAAVLAGLAGASLRTEGIEESPVSKQVLQEIAQRLWEAQGRSLVVCGSQDVSTQVLCNFINHLLGSYGSTINLELPSNQRRGNDRELQSLLEELRQSKVAALIVSGVNPIYDLPDGEHLAPLLRQVPLVVSLDGKPNETTELAHFVCPDHHGLESWGDQEPVSGIVSLMQPCIQPLGDTRALTESLAAWMGTPKSAHDILRENWQARIFPRQTKETSFQAFWDHAVHDGFVELEGTRPIAVRPFAAGAVRPILAASSLEEGEFALALYPTVGMLDGRHADNPWLQELPDPITKVTWDNYASLSPAVAAQLRVREGDVVRLATGNDQPGVELPVVIQPGQHDRVVAVALGYGSKATERFAGMGPQWLEGKSTVGETGRVGVNAAPLLQLAEGALQYWRAPVRLQPTGKHLALASTQTHHSIQVPPHLATPGTERRPIIQETSLQDFRDHVAAGQHRDDEAHEDLWPQDHQYTGHRWAMAIDLNACTGCSACVIACQAENNVPVVGKDEVRRRRVMHWIRIDRYYDGDEAEAGVAHQPMLCQHCENAPCETVCPVLATVHNAEGLNQQIYNRCVGTRYCSNNCPYKVRRFNWFDYPHEDRLENMVLNPDVTVRSRGVMEKCSFCVQRIQEAKIEAQRNGELLRDGVLQTACQQSCPARAIVFGDKNDPNSRVSQLLRSSRRYYVLQEINVRPSIGYLKLVRHRLAEAEGENHG